MTPHRLLAPCLIAVLATASSAFAAPPPAARSASSPRADSGAAVSGADLSRFVAAYREVIRIRRKFMIQTHGITDDEKIATLEAQAEQQMEQEIRSHMTLGEYVRIGKAVNADKALHARFMRMMDPARKAPPAATG